MDGKTGYSVHELAELSGVSVRTLHHYDDIGLLVPTRLENQYRSYGLREVERLQQILLYREMGVGLKDIKEVLDDASFDAESALKSHLENLMSQRERTDALIESVEKTLASMKRKKAMEDKERFEGFKKKLVDENEEKYGTEVREKYGDDAVDASNAKLMGMSEEKYAAVEKLQEDMFALLKAAMEAGDPGSEEAQKACDLHRQWLSAFWKDGTYSKEAHKGITEMYVADERFKVYYEAHGDGTAEFLRDAVAIYCA